MTDEVWLTDDYGVRLAQLTTFTSLSASKSVDNIGWIDLVMPASFDVDMIAPDRMIQYWLKPRGGRLFLWNVYFLRKWKFSNQDNLEIITISGPDKKELLRRRIVAAFAASPQAKKTGYADDIMKAVVRESLLDTAEPLPIAGTRAWPNFSVQPDLGLGPIVTKGFAFGKLMTSSDNGVLPTIARVTREAGNEVFYDVVPDIVTSNSINFQFQTFIGCPGADKTASVVFDQRRGNMKNPSEEHDHSDEENYLYAGGQGDMSTRIIRQASDAARYGQSQWGRCEGFIEATNQADPDGVLASAQAALEDGRPKIRFAAEAVDTGGTVFGADWDCGDLVTSRYRNIEYTSLVSAVVVSRDDSGRKIQSRLEYRT